MIDVHVIGEDTTLVTAGITGSAAILGVIVGSLLSSGREWLFRKHDADGRRRRAARILLNEVAWYRVIAKEVLDEDDPRHWEDPEPLHDLWRQHRDALADIPMSDWQTLEFAMRNLYKNLPSAALEPGDGDDARKAGRRKTAEAFAPALERLDAAVRVLAKYVE
jgi:hypothetical protein